MNSNFTSCFKKLCLAFCFLLALQLSTKAQLPAFPGAEGFGKFATGGRTGSVYHVTNLNNSGAGSLRDGVSQPNRIVVFDVAGVIKITERMVVSANIYIAGQTAPGEGITVYGNGWSFSNAHNTICRYMRIRMGNVGSSGNDAIGIADGKNMIFDHCSVSWGRDETFSINSSTSENITIQNCIISQGLLTHSAGGLIQAPGGITLYRNVYVDNGTRNNKIKGVNQYVNNIVYNWKDGAYIMGGDSQGESFANAVGNLFVQGPADGVRPFNLGNNQFHLYENDNLHDNNRNGVLDAYTIPQSEFGGAVEYQPDFKASPYAYPVLPTVAANSLLQQVLPTAGACLPYRDLADYYVVNELKSLGARGEFIAKEDVLPFGVPTSWNVWTGTARTDTDNDGMPDTWENSNGLNPNSASDAMQLAANNYTNIENYINGISASNSQDFLRAPMKLKQDSATQSTIYLSWFDYTEKEQGYIVERKINNVFVQIGTTGVNENFFAVTGMQPEEKDTFRVRAFYAGGESGNSNELIAKTKPVEVPVLDPSTFTPDLTWAGAVDGNWDKSTLNWLNAGNAALFADSSKLLFAEAGVAGQSINLTAQMGPKDVLINSGGDYNFSGAGFIAGSGSLNKTGTGKLVLNGNNTYTGATVLRNGVLQFGVLANGGLPSSIGASANYGFNWVWKGGTLNYTGANVTTDRNAVIDNSTDFSVANASSAVTLTGSLSGAGGLIKSGAGKLVLRSANAYEGETIIRGGVLEVSPIDVSTEANDIIHNGVALGTSNVLRLEGGTFRASNGSTSIYENYPMKLYVKEGTENGFEPYRNANLMMDVSGGGTLNYAITYSRELIQGDWSGFTGTLVANGVGVLTGGERSMLMFDNGAGMPNTRINAIGNTKIASYQNAQTLYLGGLSGTSSTTLACGNKTAGGLLTWSVGAANTDETFSGVINNEAYGSSSAFGTTSIIKEGDGVWRLTNTNPYSGTTTITGGSLVVNGNHTGNGVVTVSAGALAGKGSVTADVTVEAGAVEPGDSSVGTLTLKGNLGLQATSFVNIDIDKTVGNFDKLNVQGNLVYNGVLQVNIKGGLASGDAFKVFTVGALSTGDFVSILPAIPAPGLLWKFTPATGILAVVEPGFVQAPSNLQLTAGATPAPGATIFVTLDWQDNSDNEQYFVIERSTDGTNFTDIAHAAANAVTFTDNVGLLENTLYYYRIKAHGDIKESVYTAIASTTTPMLASKPLQAATPSPAHTAQNVILNNGKAMLQWTGSGNTVNYELYFGTTSGSLTKLSDIAYSSTPSFETAALNPNTTYYWRIDATNANGTTTGIEWWFKTSGIPVAATGDYRSAKSGNWGTSGSTPVATDIWETFDGTSWAATATIPGSAVNTVTIRSGHVVTLNATTAVGNLVIENGGTLKSGLADGATGSVANRNLRVKNSVTNFGVFGSSSVSAERLNIEGYLANGTIILSGTNRYYVNNFSVNLLAETLEMIIDADMNLSGYMRSYYSTTPSGTPSQDDDDVTITIASGRNVTMGSSGYLQSGSSPTTNTIAQFGKYTFNINGTFDMRSTGTSCIVAHSTLANSKTTINVSGTWITGNAMRLVSTNTTIPLGGLEFNITGNGVVDAGARVASGTGTATNLVQANGTTGQTIFFNISDNGVLKNRVPNSDITYHIGSGGVYSPVKLNNSGTADMVSVGVKSSLDYPVIDPTRIVVKQFNIQPDVPATTNLAISLGWVLSSQATNFNPANGIMLGHYVSGFWNEANATLSGLGTMASPYYAKASGYTSFSLFVVGNANGALPLQLIGFNGLLQNGQVNLDWKTSFEVNTKHFVVQRSNNGVAFTSIGTVNAMGSGNHQYTFTDTQPFSGIAYYKLQMVDKDGSSSYSRTIAVQNNNNGIALQLHPNPAHAVTTVTHAALVKASSILVYSAAGKLVTTVPVAAGSTQTLVNVSQLAAGAYLLVLNDGSQQAIRFVKY
ncbi:MAG TPA: autotransporter-associated beta strand repeat-containing protein [Phnomibacter sp.]|nr:autotransporter-associated beta strand repeat-containing protein [Phnomibacter sp.]